MLGQARPLARAIAIGDLELLLLVSYSFILTATMRHLNIPI